MNLRYCDAQGCGNLAALMRCNRCLKYAACWSHCRQEPQFGNHYICFACMYEIDEVARKAWEEQQRQQELARLALERKQAEHSIICPACDGTGGWNGIETRKYERTARISGGEFESSSSYSYRAKEDVSYFLACNKCNKPGGIIGRLTPAEYAVLEVNGLTYRCPGCEGQIPRRCIYVEQYGYWWENEVNSDEFRAERTIESPMLYYNCSLCHHTKLVNKKQYDQFMRSGAKRGSLYFLEDTRPRGLMEFLFGDMFRKKLW